MSDPIRTYNGFGQLLTEAVNHNGATTGSGTRTTTYHYAPGSDGARPTGMSYPSGYRLYYGYANGLDDEISRISNVSESIVNGEIESYRYLGLATPAQIKTELGNGSHLHYELGNSDIYSALDPFGRVFQDHWSLNGTSVTNRHYGRDADGRLLYTRDQVHDHLSELFHANHHTDPNTAYDRLGKRYAYQRGLLNLTGTAVIASQSQDQQWWTDTQGRNERTGRDDEVTRRPSFNYHDAFFLAPDRLQAVRDHLRLFYNADTAYIIAQGDQAPDTEQVIYTRFNPWKQVTRLETYTPRFSPYLSEFQLDLPEFGSRAQFYYDALGRRIEEAWRDAAGNTTRTHLALDTAGRVLEEFNPNASSLVARHVYSPVTGKLILRDRDTTADGSLDERLLAQVDAQGHVIALVDHATGSVVERYLYDPDGRLTVIDAAGVIQPPGTESAYHWRVLWNQAWHDGCSFYLQANGSTHDSLQGVALSPNPTQLVSELYGQSYQSGKLDWWVAPEAGGIDLLLLAGGGAVGAVAGGLIAGLTTLGLGAPAGALVGAGAGAGIVAGFLGYDDRRHDGLGLGMSLAGGVTDATPIGGLYTFATGDLAFTGQTEDLGITGRAFGALDAALVVAPWVRPGTHALRALTRSKGRPTRPHRLRRHRRSRLYAGGGGGQGQSDRRVGRRDFGLVSERASLSRTAYLATEVGRVRRMLNDRPRKCLGYRTPLEVLNALPGAAIQH